MPRLAAACEEGRVTASLAASVARTASEPTEEELVALCETAAPGKVERVCRTKARIGSEDRSGDPARADEPARPAADDARYASWGACDDGRGWELHAWLPSVEGARVASGGTVDRATVAALDVRLAARRARRAGGASRADRRPHLGGAAHLRRAVLARDGHTCAHPACGSARGLEVHHVVHRSAGGDHDPASRASRRTAVAASAASAPRPQ